MKTLNRLLLIFIGAFVLNLIWEHLHSVLYASYKGEAVTNLILLRAALFDAAVISFLSYPFLRSEALRRKRWILYLALVIFAVLLEKWALMTGRWAYTDAMPIIPFLDVGLTPAIQLGLLGYVSKRVSDLSETKATFT
ncbi:MAG TPA: hypothetical protein DEF00_04340 [Candidatus Taylorbacteria bacterium]|nr:MAG: Membrane protein [Parcubacteria group bacterium GW2011_GWA2_47_64]KKU97130.1 MAG: Membrane protein [Parcubacteria group bacterium GW2011_GWC2_48_17]HBV01582.1 hypothetical protein [Candidatus Taylorbacteria bacterium]